MMTLAKHLAGALQAASKGNAHTAAPTAAVLWPDNERQWEPALGRLRQSMPNLLTLGSYDVDRRTGPAIWLKCAMEIGRAHV